MMKKIYSAIFLKNELMNRLKMARSAFLLKENKSVISGYEYCCNLNGSYKCDMDKVDGNICDNVYKICISRTVIELVIKKDDYVHVCNECASKMFGSKKEKNDIVINGE